MSIASKKTIKLVCKQKVLICFASVYLYYIDYLSTLFRHFCVDVYLAYRILYRLQTNGKTFTIFNIIWFLQIKTVRAIIANKIAWTLLWIVITLFMAYSTRFWTGKLRWIYVITNGAFSTSRNVYCVRPWSVWRKRK